MQVPPKSVIRSLQTRIPGLWEAKHRLYNRLTRNFGLMMEDEFRLLSRMGPIGLVVDIGANYGQSIHAIRRCARPARIVSFEPIAALAARLRQEFAGDPGVEIQDCALAESAGELTLHVPRYDHAVLDALASLDREAIVNWLANPYHFWNFDPRKLTISAQAVTVRTLDSFGFAPDVVKIDVQKMEQAVVEGGLETFRAHQPLTIVEAPSPAVIDLFADCGMRAYAYAGGRLRDTRGERINMVFLGPAMRARIGL
ncbi:FkbM family methyltransferase [Erythrobacter donghaensis]|uniref:FkbM family methyltransferase n=1 Tax=Erythrobacter donghaensis TaxID=267135 RepID=UPI00117E2B8A|nr:FkbM family methyltransferase [Erythrobacter donghaensis]